MPDWESVVFQQAEDRLFVQRTGGSYIFIHRTLQEHFATLADWGDRECPSRETGVLAIAYGSNLDLGKNPGFWVGNFPSSVPAAATSSSTAPCKNTSPPSPTRAIANAQAEKPGFWRHPMEQIFDGRENPRFWVGKTSRPIIAPVVSLP